MEMLYRHYTEIEKVRNYSPLPIAAAAAFHIQDVVMWVVEEVRGRKRIEAAGKIIAVKPPFQNIWMEFSNRSNQIGHKGVSAFGAQIVSFDFELDDGSIGTKIHFYHFYEAAGHCAPVGKIEVSTNEHGDLLDDGTGILMEGYLPQESNDAWFDSLRQITIFYLAALSLANVKNIDYVPTDVPPKVRESRLKKGLPNIQFKTLAIIPFRQRLQKQYEENPNGPQPLELAFHLVRGHFKDFREKGLFGKEHLKGVYWWDAHARGDEDNGIIVKDYEIEVK